MSSSKPIAIYYRREAYCETLKVRAGTDSSSGPRGLMGREVASKGFLHSLLQHGNWSSLEALIESNRDRASLTKVCQEALAASPLPRHVHLKPVSDWSRWLCQPTAEVLCFPYPPEDRFAWARQRTTSPKFAMAGITHTLCSLPGLESLWRMVVGPWESFDRLVCTSRAVMHMVRSVTDVMCQYLAEQTGGQPHLRLGLECIPLGVDVQERRPPRPAARHEVRRQLGIGDDRFVMLFVGRLSHHAKAQPYPMFVAAQQAAEKLGQDVYLVQCGWYSHPHVRDAYQRTAMQVAPNVRLIVVDGLDPWWRTRVWDAADLFVSLADSIQETFGLTILEAMAHGLPVVASDWNGYRDTVSDGETGLLVPTAMLRDATRDATLRLVTHQLNYDSFLAEVGQTVTVSVPDACRAIERLALDPPLRRQFGLAGRRCVEQHFDWRQVVASHESMWETQREELAAASKKSPTISLPETQASDVSSAPTNADSRQGTRERVRFDRRSAPANYPPIEIAFAAYPSRWLDDNTRFSRSALTPERVVQVFNDPLLNHSMTWRELIEPVVHVYRSLGEFFSIDDVQSQLRMHNLSELEARPLVAWLLKYGLVRYCDSDRGSEDGASQIA